MEVREDGEGMGRMQTIHRSAHVNRRANLADPCSVAQAAWVYEEATLGEDAAVGRGTKVGAGAYIGDGTRIGADCVIGRRALVAAGIRIEDGVHIGAAAILRNEQGPRAVSSGGPNRVTFKPQRPLLVVREGATIGPGAIVNRGLTIGRHALITAGSVVTGDVPDYALMVGNPAQLVGRVCPAGHRMGREGVHTWYCDICEEAFEAEGGEA